MDNIIYILFLIALLVTIREGLQQRDRVQPGKGVSKLWHFTGFLIRLSIFAVMVFLRAPVFLLLITALVIWPLYNIACNLGARQPWYYLSDKGTDGVIKRLFNIKP